MSRVLLTNGPIITSDGRAPTSLAIEDDRIVAIGDEAASWSASFDQVVQLNGRAVVAGFRDGHAHPLHAGINRTELDLTDVTTYEGIIDRLRRWADAHPNDPPVSSHRPLDGLAVAVTRRNAKGEPVDGWVPEERISILQAIDAYTAGSAFQAFDDDAGALAVGARADLVVLDRDITAIAGDEVPGASVDETWVNGTQVFRRN